MSYVTFLIQNIQSTKKALFSYFLPSVKRTEELTFTFYSCNGTPLQYSCLENPMDGGAWKAAGVAEGRTRPSDFTFTFHFHALEKEMATHSSVLAWRISGMGEPGGLLSMGSHRVGHDWSDLAAAEIALQFQYMYYFIFVTFKYTMNYLVERRKHLFLSLCQRPKLTKGTWKV